MTPHPLHGPKAAGGSSAAARRRLWWRRFTTRQALERHPVSVGRSRAGLSIFAFLVAAIVYYGVITRDESIRRSAIVFLSEATSGEVDVAGAHFRMFGGITLRNVRITVPFDREFDPVAVSPASREIFSAASLHLVHSPWRLLFGGLHVDEVIAVNPKITLAHNVDTGQRNWQLLTGRMGAGSGIRARPLMTVRSAKVVLAGMEASGKRDLQEESLDADVRPYPQSETGYCIEVRRFSRPAERVTVVFDPGAKLVTNTPFVDARAVRMQLPKVAKEFFDRIALEGEVKLDRMIYDPKVSVDRDTEIELRRVRCKIPLALLRSGTESAFAGPAEKAGEEKTVAVEMTRVQGKIDLRGERLDLNISGYINNAKCNVKGHVTGSERVPEEMGIDLNIEASRIPAPEGPFRERLATGQMVPEMIRAIMRDYDPHGLFDVALHICRPPGHGQEMSVTGHFSPLGASAAFIGFPYRVDELHGRVRFEPPMVYIDAVGVHGPAKLSFKTEIHQGVEWPRVEVVAKGTGVPLDPALLELLPESYQRLWHRFEPKGVSNMVVRTRRPSSDEMDEPPWITTVTADLVDTELLFASFPYRLEQVVGRITVESDRIKVANLSGRHGDATVQIDGYADLDANGKLRAAPAQGPEAAPAAAAFQIAAHALQMDDALAAALPAEGRGAFEQFQPQGQFDLEGSISIPSEGAPLEYDLLATLKNVAVRYREFPYLIEAATGEIRLQHEGVSVLQFVGHHGDATISARGSVKRLEDGYMADLDIETRNLPLDDALQRSLPSNLLRVWEMLRPGAAGGDSGRVNSKTSLHYATRTGVTGAPEVSRNHRTELEASGASLKFSGLPLPLTDVNARAVVTDQRVDIVSLDGRTGDGNVRLSGTIDIGEADYQGTLNLRADGMAFDKDVIGALPAAFREAVRSTSPQGRFDVRFEPIIFDIDEKGAGRWDANGELTLHEASMNVGLTAENVHGKITGRMVIDPTAKVAVDVDAALDKATLAGWNLTDVRGKLLSDSATGGASRIRIDDAVAAAYGGEATCSAEIDLRKNHVAWQASLVGRNIRLASFLESMGGTKNSSATGTVEGNMILQGRSGTNSYYEGAGELFIRDAQVWRLPLVFAIFQVLNLTPDENIFHDGWIKYYLSRDTLTFQKIDLQGKAVAFIGGGRMDMRSKQIDITLVAGSPVRFKVPLVTELLEGASRELMEVRLTGTMNQPNIQPQPLKSLTRALQTIFPEPPPKAGSRKSPRSR